MQFCCDSSLLPSCSSVPLTAAPVVEWLIVLIFHYRTSSHLTAVSGHVRQAKFCLQVCQVFFSRGYPFFAPPID